MGLHPHSSDDSAIPGARVRDYPMALHLLGGFEFLCNGRSVQLPAVAQKLTAFTALQSRPVSRLYIAGCLWPDNSEERAAANLRSTVWRMGGDGRKAVAVRNGQLQLSPLVALDVRECESWAHWVLDPSSSLDVVDVDEVVHKLSADLLPDWYEDWVLMERERIRQLRLHALESLCHRLTAARRCADAVAAGVAAVSTEPLRESAQRVLIAAYLAEGNRGEALRQYASFRRLLATELGLTPSPLMERIISTMR